MEQALVALSPVGGPAYAVLLANVNNIILSWKDS